MREGARSTAACSRSAASASPASAPNQGDRVRAAEGLRRAARATQHSAKALVGQLFGAFSQITGAMVIPFLPPSIQGLGQFGGFTYELLDQSGGPIQGLAAAAQQLIGAGQPDAGARPACSRSSPPTIRSSSSTIDREQAKSLGVSLSDDHRHDADSARVGVRQRLRFQQPLVPRLRPGRSAVPRATRATSSATQRRGLSRPARMMPLEQRSSRQFTRRPRRKSINHYNLFRSAEINGSAAPGYSSGQALQAMEQLSRHALPQGMSFAWSGLSLEEIKAGSQSTADLRARPAARLS